MKFAMTIFRRIAKSSRVQLQRTCLTCELLRQIWCCIQCKDANAIRLKYVNYEQRLTTRITNIPNLYITRMETTCCSLNVCIENFQPRKYGITTVSLWKAGMWACALRQLNELDSLAVYRKCMVNSETCLFEDTQSENKFRKRVNGERFIHRRPRVAVMNCIG